VSAPAFARIERPLQATPACFNHGPSLHRKGAEDMRPIQGIGLYKDIVEAPSPGDPARIIKLGIRRDTFEEHVRWGLRSAIAQYYGIVQEGLIVAQHCFRGLKRPLLLNGDMNADRAVLVYTWRSWQDYEWAGTPQYGRPQLITPPPADRVFVVLIREIEQVENEVIGSVEKWNWVREDPTLPGAPIDWEIRYGKKLWSRET
jgi:hypothetical protein